VAAACGKTWAERFIIFLRIKTVHFCTLHAMLQVKETHKLYIVHWRFGDIGQLEARNYGGTLFSCMI